MTLATFLLIGIFCIAPVVPLVASRYHGPPSGSENQTGTASGTQDQNTASPATTSNTSQTPAPATPGKTPAQTQPSTTKRPRRTKKATASDCKSAPAATQGASGSSSSTPASNSATAGKDSAAATSNAPTNCPPSKVIIRQGGTSDQSIELAGGATGNQASDQRDAANQMVGTTEANLKKIAGQQLSPERQDMVKQIRQFMEQSKKAAGDGDLDRARTLAWKAQVLSEELVKPAQ